jgi:hypothetical protein
MKNKARKIFTILQLAAVSMAFPVITSATETFHFSKWTEKISILPKENRFLSSVHCVGSTPERSSIIVIPYSETEEVTDIHVNFYDDYRETVLKDSLKIFNSSYDGEAFYENMRGYGFDVPATPSFDFSFKKSERDLMFLAALNMNPYSVTDTVEYEIEVPKDHAFLYKLCNIDSTVKVTIDSAEGDKFIFFRIVIINHPVEKSEIEEIRQSHPSVLKVYPAIKTLLLPRSETAAPEKYLNKWLQKFYARIPALTKKNFIAIQAETGMLNDTDAVIKNVFRFVQTKIKYIDIENGVNAFRPRDPNMIFSQKQGDCKDMAFLIHAILEGYGIKSNLALSASISHLFDMDFPSLASANHIICTVMRKGSWIFLDATEDVCEFGYPSLHIQGKHIFITGDDLATYVFVKPVSAINNESVFNISLKMGQHPTEGNFSYQFLHTGAASYKHFYSELNKTDFDILIKELLKDLAYGCDHKSVDIKTTDSTIFFTGSISINRELVIAFGSRNYLPLSFLPYLDGLPKTQRIMDPLICYSTLNKKGHVEFKFDRPVHLINERSGEFNENGFSFTFKLRQSGPETIETETHLIYDDVTITGSRLESYHHLILFIDDELNKGVVYE